MNNRTVREYKDSTVQEVNSLMKPQGDEDDVTRIKRKINNFLWEELPTETTMGDAEIMACRIFKMLQCK